MKKTLFFGLMATALGLAACSDEKEAIFTENTQKGMILNATVREAIDTRATIDNSEKVWLFNFSSGDKVLVSNPELEAAGGTLYEFTSDATHFSCAVAEPTSSAVTWTARYPKGAVDLTNQTGKLEDVAKNYALVGTSAPTTGASGLNIDMEAKVAILKIVNGGGVIKLNMKKSNTEWVTGLSADDFSLVTSTSEATLFETNEAGDHYVVVPAGIQLSIKDGNSISLKSTTVSGFTAGKYYTMTINGAEWRNYLTLGNAEAETVVVQVGVTKPSSGYYDLNSAGDVWEYYDAATKTDYIQSNRLLVKGAKWGHEFAGFKKLKKIENLNLIDWTGVKNFDEFCYNCYALEEFDFKDIYTESAESMNKFFGCCRSLKNVDFGNINTANVKDMGGMFWWCNSLEELDLSKFNTSKCETMGAMFSQCEKLTTITGLTNFNTANVTNMNSMFYQCKALESLDLSSFNTEKVTTMVDMFRECESLEELDLSSFKAQNVTTMGAMFYGSKSLKKVIFDDINTLNLENMASMFGDCESLEELDLSSFKTSNVTTMRDMIRNCKSLKKADLSGLTNENVTNMYQMFENCESLKELNLTGFNTSNVTDMGAMFRGCKSLEELDLSSFNINKVTSYWNINDMFRYNDKLVKLTLSDNLNLPTGQEHVFYSLGTADNHCMIHGLPPSVQTQIIGASLGWSQYFEFVNP